MSVGLVNLIYGFFTLPAGHFHMAEGAFARIKNYELAGKNQLDLGPFWELEEPLLYWDRKEEEKAKFLLRGIIEREEQPSSPLLLPLALSTMGSWLAESNMASPAVISKFYLDKAASETNSSSSSSNNKTAGAKAIDRQNLKQIHVTLARFSDGQYSSIKDHMDSSLYAEKMRVLKEQVRL